MDFVLRVWPYFGLVVIGSLLARDHGVIGRTALLVVNGVNGLVPVAAGLACVAAVRRRG